MVEFVDAVDLTAEEVVQLLAEAHHHVLKHLDGRCRLIARCLFDGRFDLFKGPGQSIGDGP